MAALITGSLTHAPTFTTPAQSNGQWAKPQHDYDVFYLLQVVFMPISAIFLVLLRSNSAKTEMLYPIGNASHIANNTCAVGIVRDWVGLPPTMTQLGYTNAVSTRKTARVAVDGQVRRVLLYGRIWRDRIRK